MVSGKWFGSGIFSLTDYFGCWNGGERTASWPQACIQFGMQQPSSLRSELYAPVEGGHLVSTSRGSNCRFSGFHTARTVRCLPCISLIAVQV